MISETIVIHVISVTLILGSSHWPSIEICDYRHKKLMFHMACKEFRKGFRNENTTTITTNEITTVIQPRITGIIYRLIAHLKAEL